MVIERVRVVSNPGNQLGEGPLWSNRRNGIYWVDILGKRVQFHSEATGYIYWALPKMPSAIAECRDGALVIAMQDEVVKFDTVSGDIVHITDLDTDRPGNRSNDGKCDRYGNFWIGTMQHEPTEKCGRLWCIDAIGNKTQILDHIGITNGLAWDTTRDRFYFADSMRGEIYCLATNGPAADRQRIFATNDGANWSPDGSTLDTDGCLWNAQWDASRIVRYTPEGQIDRVIAVPVKRPTSCTFGGADFSTLFVTSAQSGEAGDTLGGALFAIDTPYRGIAADTYGG